MKSPTAFYTGVSAVVATHAYMLVKGMTADQHTYHAYINLVAAGLIVYGGMD